MTHLCDCQECRDYLDDQNHIESLIASDPERDPRCKPATDVEYRDHLNDTMPIVTRYPSTPHPVWGGLVLTEEFIHWFIAAPFTITTSQV